MRPWDFKRLAPADLFDMLDAVEEHRSREREWIADLVAAVINLCHSPNVQLKQRVEGVNLLFHSDKQRALRRLKAAQEAARRDPNTPAAIASADWGEL